LNSRPLQDPTTQEALNLIAQVYRYYDLAGGVAVVNAQEWGYGYVWQATWNACVEDPDLPARDGLMPLGFRIRAREADLGRARAQELLTGTAFTLTSLKDFGTQTRIWAEDLIRLLRQHGLRIAYTPFGGQRLPRIQGLDLRQP
jgi:hypothetical protein